MSVAPVGRRDLDHDMIGVQIRQKRRYKAADLMGNNREGSTKVAEPDTAPRLEGINDYGLMV